VSEAERVPLPQQHLIAKPVQLAMELLRIVSQESEEMCHGTFTQWTHP
jgi:hypothetical protein